MDSAAPDALPHSTERTEVLAPPELTDGESFHVFVSYSSSDLHWTHTLIQQLEDRGLRVCYHDRDFIPGWPILDNMSSCIQKSQKVLLVLSQDFVRSRWCLLEANISMFRDCLHRKPVVPVLLQRDLSIPLHLSHLTYLEASHPNFSQELLRVLCTPNHKLQNTTMVPHQLPNLYNGKVLQPLKSIDEIVSEIDCGEWSTLVPDQLRLIIKDRAFYMDAIKIINRVNKEKVKFKVARAYNMTFVVLTFFASLIIGLSLFLLWRIILDIFTHHIGVTTLLEALVLVFILIGFLKLRKSCNNEPHRILKELKKAVCEANTLLYQEHILMGVCSNKELCLVYVVLEACEQELRKQFPDKNDVLRKALLRFSSIYARYLSMSYFPFEPCEPGHVKDSVCFCQCVLYAHRVHGVDFI